MYLVKLYKHNKILCGVIVLFALAQLVNNIKQDIAISPVYSYGMYSEKISPAETYTVPEVFVNGKQLQTKNFTPQQWDNIIVPVSKYYEQKEWNNAMWHTDIERLLPFSDSTKFLNNLPEEKFKDWYKNHLSVLLGKRIDSMNILFSRYTYNNIFQKEN